MIIQPRSQNLSIKILTGLGIFILAILWIFAFWRYRISSDFVPLHYTIYFGLDRFGPKYDLFLFPSFGTVILVLNIFISRIVFADNRLWKGIALGLTFMMELILLASLVLVVLKDLS